MEVAMRSGFLVRSLVLVAAVSGTLLGPLSGSATAGAKADGSPQVVVISLDGARADLVHAFLKSGVLDKKTGLGRLDTHGVVASQNITLTPSLTAVAHIGIATGSSSAHNDIPANTFHPVAESLQAALPAL